MFTPASVSVVNVASTAENIHAAARRRLDRPPRVIAFDLRPLAPKRSRKLPSETTFTTTNVRSRARARSNASTRPLARIRINPSHRTASCARAHHRRRRRHLPLSRDADDDDDDRESFARRVASIERLASDHASRAAGHVLKRPRGRRGELPARRSIWRSVRAIWCLHTTFVIVFRTFLGQRAKNRTNALDRDRGFSMYI